ncbi:hypothetical protein COCOBI_05-3240 [Coccomyxa sp. Obi]|nr:hypothetical protein COCOBI_05-3240 [Coccomyxa sp. Obi]
MAGDDVEKRLNSSLDDLIASSKKAGAGRGGKGAAQGRGKAGRGRSAAKPGGPARGNQGNSTDRNQAGLAKKKGLKPVGGGVQKQGAANGRVKAVPVRVTGGQRGGGGGRRGGAGGRGAGGRQQAQQPLHPAALKITIRNDKYTGEAPSAAWNDQGSDPYTVGGFGPRSGYYGQAAGPLTFGGASAAASASAAPRQQRPVFAAGGYYNGTQHDERTGAGIVRRPATQWAAQSGYGSGGLRMDQEAQRY